MLANVPRDNSHPKILSPDRSLGKGGLPGDLKNAANCVYYAIILCERGTYTIDEARESILGAQTFDDYYRNQVVKRNECWGGKEGFEPFDSEASVAAQRAVIPDAKMIEEFDELIIRLRDLGRHDLIDFSAIKELILSEILPLVDEGKRP